MKESKLTKEEKSMYGLSFMILIIGIFLLMFLDFNSLGSITGFAVQEVPDNENTILENITQKAALNAILEAEKDMRDMQEQGFGIVWVNDTLIEAKKYFEGENYTSLLEDVEGLNDTKRKEQAKRLLTTAQEKIGFEVDYKKVLEKTRTIHDRKEKAYEINDLIRASELRIAEFKQEDLDTSEVKGILSDAVSEFQDERYEDAESLLKPINSILIGLSAETTLARTIYRAGKENLANFIKENYKWILSILGLLSVIALLLYNRITALILKRKIQDMKIEIEVLEDLTKKAQSDYFARGSITKQTFDIKKSNYKERLVEIKRKLPVMETRLGKTDKTKRKI